MPFIINLFYFVLVLGIIVFIHELGHLLAAKAFGVYCNEFAIGMGPTIFKLKKPHWETTYSIRLLPLGGFVSMAGEPGEGDMGVPVERTVPGIAPWKRLIIMLAGIAMNFLLAFVIFTGFFTMYGTNDVPLPIVKEVVEGGPADKAGLQANDHITKITFFDGGSVEPKNFNDVTLPIMTYGGRELIFEVDRNGETLEFTLTPQKDGERWVIGIYAQDGVHRSVSFFEALKLSVDEIVYTVSSLAFLLLRLVRGIGTDAVGGPVQIFKVTSDISVGGFPYFLILVASLSINVGVINAIPIPIFDGGRALLTLIEMVIRRPIPEKLENFVMMIGLAIVAVLFVLIMYKDLFLS